VYNLMARSWMIGGTRSADLHTSLVFLVREEAVSPILESVVQLRIRIGGKEFFHLEQRRELQASAFKVISAFLIPFNDT
jgi:hypothetical protein